MRNGFSRRGFLTGALATVAAAGAATALAGCSDAQSKPKVAAPIAFRGIHQAGIATPAQDRLAFAAFDVTTTKRADLIQLLRTWTTVAEKMTQGKPVGPIDGVGEYVPADTGETTDLPHANLTITIGFGPNLFDDRYGLASHKPSGLQPLPGFPREELDPTRSGGDICIQACADDPQVAFHAIRNLNRAGFGIVAMKWFQLGFGRTSSTSLAQQTPRNLLGFKDGTRNILGEDTAGMDDHVWIGPGSDQAWALGGSYLVTRRIRMLIENWDRDRISDQQNIIGRFKASGAPLSGKAEHDTPDLSATHPDGSTVIATDSHIRLAAPESNHGVRILRRGYSFTDGAHPLTGQLDAGLFFICYQSDPRTGFIPVQRALATDALNEYIKHTSTGIFLCPPGPAAGEYWGQKLFS